jgi:hypothetical protein
MEPHFNPPANDIPSPIVLFNVFNQFLIRWANQECRYIDLKTEDLSPLTLEQGILFFEPFQGIFVVRSTLALERFLVELATGKKAGRKAHEKGIFLEMSVLFWHMFVSQQWRLDTRILKPAILKASAPVDWPDRKPTSMCTVFVKNNPLEIRIWADVTEAEAALWRKKTGEK